MTKIQGQKETNLLPTLVQKSPENLQCDYSSSVKTGYVRFSSKEYTVLFFPFFLVTWILLQDIDSRTLQYRRVVKPQDDCKKITSIPTQPLLYFPGTLLWQLKTNPLFWSSLFVCLFVSYYVSREMRRGGGERLYLNSEQI